MVPIPHYLPALTIYLLDLLDPLNDMRFNSASTFTSLNKCIEYTIVAVQRYRHVLCILKAHTSVQRNVKREIDTKYWRAHTFATNICFILAYSECEKCCMHKYSCIRFVDQFSTTANAVFILLHYTLNGICDCMLLVSRYTANNLLTSSALDQSIPFSAV